MDRAVNMVVRPRVRVNRRDPRNFLHGPSFNVFRVLQVFGKDVFLRHLRVLCRTSRSVVAHHLFNLVRLKVVRVEGYRGQGVLGYPSRHRVTRDAGNLNLNRANVRLDF